MALALAICMPDMLHESVFFSGRVQGVGFRYATLQIAKEFDVTGYVTNLPDGRVHVEAEGSPDEVKAFVSAIQERMHGYIRKTEQKSSAGTGGFQGFTIK